MGFRAWGKNPYYEESGFRAKGAGGYRGVAELEEGSERSVRGDLEVRANLDVGVDGFRKQGLGVDGFRNLQVDGHRKQG